MKLLQRPSRQLSIIICLCILACAFWKNLYMLCFMGAPLVREVGKADLIPIYQMRKWEQVGILLCRWFLTPKATIRDSCHTHRFKILSLCKDQVWLGFVSHVCVEKGRLRVSSCSILFCHTDVPASLDPGRRERNFWPTLGWKLTFLIMWRWGGRRLWSLRSSEMLRCRRPSRSTEQGAGCLCFEGQRCPCPVSVCQLSSWVIREHQYRGIVLGRHSHVCSEAQGISNMYVVPAMCLAWLYQGFWKARRSGGETQVRWTWILKTACTVCAWTHPSQTQIPPSESSCPTLWLLGVNEIIYARGLSGG